MSNSKIEWTDKTWNPVTGCTKYSAGCANCYAETMANRLKAMGIEKYKNGFDVTMHDVDTLEEPLKWKKPCRVFVCSMSDLFQDEVPFGFISDVMAVAFGANRHTFLFLTKRAKRMYDFFAPKVMIPGNFELGVTVENQDAKERIEWLRKIQPATQRWQVTRFLSCEPLLEDLGELDLSGISRVIVGGESGAKARPMKEEWVLNIKRQCDKQNVKFFFKQWGTYGADGIKRNKKANGCLLHGKEYKE